MRPLSPSLKQGALLKKRELKKQLADARAEIEREKAAARRIEPAVRLSRAETEGARPHEIAILTELRTMSLRSQLDDVRREVRAAVAGVPTDKKIDQSNT